jgi:hypothetical protein
MATGLIIGGAALSAAGTISGGFSARKQSKRQARALQQQAAFQRQQAQLERELGEFDALQQARSFNKLMGRQRLAFAGSGIKLEGSPLDILDESLRDKEETIENIRTLAESRARALEFGAGQLGQQAKDTKRAGRNALIGSIFGAAGSGLQAKNKLNRLE